jgi:hypothetical protein
MYHKKNIYEVEKKKKRKSKPKRMMCRLEWIRRQERVDDEAKKKKKVYKL